MLLLPKELALFLVCIGQGGLPSGVQAASLSQIELADALDAIASPGQDSHSWLEHTAAAIPAIAALCLFVVCIALCAGRKQQLNISDEGEAEEEGTTSIFSCCQPRILNKEPSVIPQDRYMYMCKLH
eukprot:scpid99446/ scgid5274/ 